MSIAAGVVVIVAACTQPEPGRDAIGATGAVTAGHPLAAEAGLRVLQGGGNAMDAAITMAGVLAVARPHMNGVGGDMFLLYYHADSGRVFALNASGRAGGAASLGDLEARGLTDMPATGPVSVSVPGAVAGWAAALERFGTLSWEEVLGPAVELARAGLPVSERLALDIAEQEEGLRNDPEAARIFLPGGQPPQAGDTLRMEDLTRTLERLRTNGPEELYAGETSRRIVSYLAEVGGLVTAEDLRANQPEWVDPLRADYHGLDVHAFPPNTQGATLLAELIMLGALDIESLGHNSADYLHTLAEVIRLAVTDRDTSIADPEYMRVSVEELLDRTRLERLAAGIDPTGRAPTLMLAADDDHPNTVYVTAADADGNAVSLIQSLFHAFGSGLVVPETGIVLHNRGSLFRFDREHPNVFGPGRRPYHTLSPAMVLRDGRPWLLFGTPGGDGQTHTLIQVLSNVFHFGMTPQAAIDAPRLRRLPDGSLAIEDRVATFTLEQLVERGYVVRPREGWTAEFGGAQAILLYADGTLRSGADRRREGWTLAY